MQNTLLISVRNLRLTIGVLGFVFPTGLIMGHLWLGDCDTILNSISAYYHTDMRDYFVGTLWAISVGMFCYYGYEARDNFWTNLAALFALGVAIFPTDVLPNECYDLNITGGIINILHLLSAFGLFIVLAYISLFLFTRHGITVTPEKKQRNFIYTICGWIIVLCCVFLLVYIIVLDGKYPWLDTIKPIFLGETIALYAFSISWFIKSEYVLGDKIYV